MQPAFYSWVAGCINISKGQPVKLQSGSSWYVFEFILKYVWWLIYIIGEVIIVLINFNALQVSIFKILRDIF
jgi:hypothetical protein